ncbi:MAG: alpha/beta hydrolase [Flavisolibacter sp.]
MKGFKLSVAAMLFAAVSFGQNQQSILLYPEKVPNSKSAPADYIEKNDKGWITKVTQPTLTIFRPDSNKATGTAIIVIPGGAYIGIAYNHEGIDVARKFAEAGVTAFLLKYRLPSDLIMSDRSIGPLQDAQRAVQIVRERAREWQIDPTKVGVIGFSAGGHLASTVGTHYKKVVIDNKANTDLRPDFMALIYPVITMGELTHAGSKQNLIGQDASADLVKLFSNEEQVDATTPPTFLVHAGDDKVVPVQNSLMMYGAIIKAGGKAEMQIYQAGGHGFGLNNATTSDKWFDHCIAWLKSNKLLR